MAIHKAVLSVQLDWQDSTHSGCGPISADTEPANSTPFVVYRNGFPACVVHSTHTHRYTVGGGVTELGKVHPSHMSQLLELCISDETHKAQLQCAVYVRMSRRVGWGTLLCRDCM